MADNRSRRPQRKLDLVAPLTFGLVAAAILAWALLRPAPPPKTVEPAAPAPAPVTPAPAAKAPETPPPLSRAELIEAARAAADAYAAGEPAPEAKDPLVGRAFALRLPFGCRGPGARGGAAQVYYEIDSKSRAVRLVAQPGSWTQSPQIQSLPEGDRPENAEGFWIPRPWTSTDTCPPPRDEAPAASPTPPAEHTVGLARLFGPGDSRLGQRGGRPYQRVIKPPADQPLAPADGFRLRLEGRVVGFANGRAARCWSETPDHRPVCLIAVTFDRVAFETADGSTISDWAG